MCGRVAGLRVRSVRTCHLWVEKWWTRDPEAGGKGGGCVCAETGSYKDAEKPKHFPFLL